MPRKVPRTRMLVSFRILLLVSALFALFFIPSIVTSSQSNGSDDIVYGDPVPASPPEVNQENNEYEEEKKSEDQEEKDVCPICQEDFQIDSNLYLTHCGHLYHEDCLSKWVAPHRSTCPLCNSIINMKDRVNFTPYLLKIRADKTPQRLIELLKYFIAKSDYTENYEKILNEIKNKKPDWTPINELEDGMSLLQFAALNNNGYAIKYLMDYGVQLNQLKQLNDQQLDNLIFYEIKIGYFDVTRQIINMYVKKDSKFPKSLCSAVRKDMIEVVKIFVEREVDLNQKEESTGRNAVQIAIIGKNIEILRLLLASGRVDFTVKTEKEESLLHLAVSTKNMEIIELLLEHESAVELSNQADINGQTPIEIALKERESQMYEVIIGKFVQNYPNFNINVPFKNDKTLLMIALDCDNMSAVEYLLNIGSDPKQFDDNQVENIILYDIEHGNSNLVPLLLKRGPLPKETFITVLNLAFDKQKLIIAEHLIKNGVGIYEEMSLYWLNLAIKSIIQEKSEIFKILYEAGAIDLSFKDSSGNNLLHIAVNSGNMYIIEFLCKNAKPDYNFYVMATDFNSLGVSPLAMAISMKIFTAFEFVVQQLRSNFPSWNVDEPDRNGNTLLMIAIDRNNFFAAEYLLNLGADKKLLNDSHIEKFVTLALQTGKPDIAADLIELVTKFNHGDYVYELYRAVEEKWINVVKLLVDKGVSINEIVRKRQNLKNFNALRMAIKTRNPEILKILLETGKADFNLKDGNGDNLFHWACSYADPDIFKLLLEYAPKDYIIAGLTKEMNFRHQAAIISALLYAESEIYEIIFNKIFEINPHWNVNEPLYGGKNVLELIADKYNTNLDAIKYLVGLGAKIRVNSVEQLDRNSINRYLIEHNAIIYK